MSTSSYSVGNRVYRGGSSAPTVGTVDPMGYIERELNKVADSRSGLAAAALRRQSTPSLATAASAPAGATEDPGAYGQTATSVSGPTGGVGAGGPVAQVAGPRVLHVSDIGRLQAPDLQGIKDNFVAPFDPEADDALTQLQVQKNNFEGSFTRGQQDLEREYTLRQRQAEDEQPYNQRNLIDDFSGRGLVHSSGYTQEVGNMQQQYANMLARLAQDKTFGEQDLLRQRGEFDDNYAMQMSSVQKAAARRAADALAQAQKDALAVQQSASQELGPVLDQYYGNAQAQGDTYAPPGSSVAVTPTGDIARALGDVPGASASYGPGTIRNAPIVDDYSVPAPAPVAPGFQQGGVSSLPSEQYQAPLPQASAPAPAQQQLRDPQWVGPIDDASRKTLAAGGTVTRGNGYVYKMSGPNGTGVPIRIR